MGEADESGDQKLALERLEIERLKIRLDHRKFVLGSVFAAIVIAVTPALFQWVTAYREQQLKEEQFYETYVTSFLEKAISQDIELRIRLADYFQHVSTERSRKDWIKYHSDLIGYRDDILKQIEHMEADWSSRAQAHGRSDPDAVRIQRRLEWAYAQLGPAAQNRSVLRDPRAPTSNWSSVQFGSLVPDGVFSSNPDLQGVPRSIRANNPAALNVSAWQTRRPGFVGTLASDGLGNSVAVYRTPEHGIASWYYLLSDLYGFGQARKFTLIDLARKYAGEGAAQSTIDNYVSEWKTFIGGNAAEFDIYNDDQMVALAKAMFRTEAGRQGPWHDSQILYAIKAEREHTLPP